MQNEPLTIQVNQTFQKIPQYLALADYDYLSARLLLLSHMPIQGFSKACEAFEKQFKILIQIVSILKERKVLSFKEIRSYGHDLKKLYSSLKQNADIIVDDSVINFLAMCQQAYDLRYPEHWKEFEFIFSLSHLDECFIFFRNLIIDNLPNEDYKSKCARFGGFLSKGLSEEFIEKIKFNGLLTPYEILILNNNSLTKLNAEIQ